jgi:hypothetical protein
MGTDWDPDLATKVLKEWIRLGAARHSHFLRPPAVAAAVMAAVSTPPGSHLPMIEVQPEAPLAARNEDQRHAPHEDNPGGTP